MAQIDTSTKGRSVNVDLNLVPFIDLMSVLITFLLISAVWTQISMIQLGASFASPKDSNVTEYMPPALEDLVLKLDVVEKGFTLRVGRSVVPIPKKNQQYDYKSLSLELTKIKRKYPDKVGIKLSIDDSIAYEHMIAVMDAGLAIGFSPELLTGGP